MVDIHADGFQENHDCPGGSLSFSKLKNNGVGSETRQDATQTGHG